MRLVLKYSTQFMNIEVPAISSLGKFVKLYSLHFNSGSKVFQKQSVQLEM